MTVTLALTWTRGVRMLLGKNFYQYVSPYQRWIKSMKRLGNNEVLKPLTKTWTFKFCDLNLKVTVMSSDGIDKNFSPVSTMMP